MKTLEERLDDAETHQQFEGHRDFESNTWQYWFVAAVAFVGLYTNFTLSSIQVTSARSELFT